ncbi:MAG: cytochrome c [Kordiimonadaceae bacterium]|jgi:nitric oxide reductase subunit C|nr:cytochrome c [Kordiimonadaceae bacterium]MBT6032056.1 cytochrome c [Kordiimonadaceae bacterium]
MTEHQPWRRILFLSLFVSFFFYSASVYTSGTALTGVPNASESAYRGQALYRENNCTACHQIYGLGGYMGPDLTNIVIDMEKGPEYAAMFIEEGTDRMPNFDLNSEQVADLVAYLEYAGAAGAYNPQKGRMTWYGTVEYERD